MDVEGDMSEETSSGSGVSDMMSLSAQDSRWGSEEEYDVGSGYVTLVVARDPGRSPLQPV